MKLCQPKGWTTFGPTRRLNRQLTMVQHACKGHCSTVITIISLPDSENEDYKYTLSICYKVVKLFLKNNFAKEKFIEWLIMTINQNESKFIKLISLVHR